MQAKPTIPLDYYFIASNTVVKPHMYYLPRPYESDSIFREVTQGMLGKTAEQLPNIWIFNQGELAPKTARKCERCYQETDSRYLIKTEDGVIICQSCK